MKGPIVIGIYAIAALAISGLAAQGAIAATKGTTAFTCVKEAGGGAASFKDSHCKESSTSGEYKHVAITEKTEAKFTNETESGTTPLLMKFTTGEFPLTLKVASVQGEASLENKLTANGEHYAEFASPLEGVGLKLSGITTSSPYCKVIGLPGGEGVIETKPLLVYTRQQEMQIKFEAMVGTQIAEFEIVGVIEPIKCLWKGTWKLVGTFKGTPSGATINFTHATITSEKSLKMGSVWVGLEGTVETTARTAIKTPYTPISTTTVETP